MKIALDLAVDKESFEPLYAVDINDVQSKLKIRIELRQDMKHSTPTNGLDFKTELENILAYDLKRDLMNPCQDRSLEIAKAIVQMLESGIHSIEVDDPIFVEVHKATLAAVSLKQAMERGNRNVE